MRFYLMREGGSPLSHELIEVRVQSQTEELYCVCAHVVSFYFLYKNHQEATVGRTGARC